ncbi:hypothetical protein Tco_1314326 [Tanacetum coccineum]
MALIWDVIENETAFRPASTKQTTKVDDPSTRLIPGPCTMFEEKTQKKNYVKARIILLNKQEVKGTANSSSSSSSQNMTFVSTPSSTNEVNTTYEVNTSSKAMLAIDGAGFDWSYMADDEVPTNMAFMAFLDSKNEVLFCEQIAVLKRDISYKDSEISELKSELEKLKQEKESKQLKIEKVNNASKSLYKLIGSQIPDKSRKGLGFTSYNAVPPPHTGLFAPPTLDLSNSGLEEFQQPEFEGYGPKISKSVSENVSNEVRKSPDAPLVEELVSDVDNFKKKTVFPTKIEFVKQQEKPVKYAEMYRSQDTVMSDSEDSTITYTVVSSPFGGLLDTRSPGVDRPPVMPKDPYAYVVAAFQAPPSPDYVSGPEYPPSPEFIPEPAYLEFYANRRSCYSQLRSSHCLLLSHPLPDSPGYVPESDPEEDPEEDDDEDPEEDPADYPIDGGDDGDDEDESSDDDEDDYVDIEGDEKEEEHPAPADSTVVALPAVDHAPSAEETEPFETDKLFAIPSLPPSPLYPWSSSLPQIPSPSPPVSPLPLPASPTYPLGYRAAMIWQRAEAPSTFHPLPLPSPIVLPHTKASVAMLRFAAPSTYILTPRSEAPPSGTPPLLPTPSPPLLPPSTCRRADVREACLPPRNRLCFAFGPGYEVGESSSAPTARLDGDFRRDYGFIATLDDEIMRDPGRDVGYGITDTWDEMLVGMPRAPATDEIELGRWVTDLVTTVRQDAYEIYRRLDDVVAQRSEIAELRAADRKRQTRLTEALKLMKTLQTQLIAL